MTLPGSPDERVEQPKKLTRRRKEWAKRNKGKKLPEMKEGKR